MYYSSQFTFGRPKLMIQRFEYIKDRYINGPVLCAVCVCCG